MPAQDVESMGLAEQRLHADTYGKSIPITFLDYGKSFSGLRTELKISFML
jgi:hypothetical protein